MLNVALRQHTRQLTSIRFEPFPGTAGIAFAQASGISLGSSARGAWLDVVLMQQTQLTTRSKTAG